MPTTNPVPSQDPSDLLFNAGKLDEVVSGSNATYTDRLGISRHTMAGIDAAADVVLGGLGYAPPVAYAAGIALTLTTQTVEYSGEVYAPKVANLPFTTSGTFETAKFRLIQGVASAYLESGVGASLVGYTPAGTGAAATTVEKQLQFHDALVVSVTDSKFAGGAKGNGVTNGTAAIQAALDYAKVKAAAGTSVGIYVPPGIYKCGALSFNPTTEKGAGRIKIYGVYGASILLSTVTGTTSPFFFVNKFGGFGAGHDWTFEGLHFKSQTAGQGIGLSFEALSWQTTVSECIFEDFYINISNRSGITFTVKNSRVIGAGSVGFYQDEAATGIPAYDQIPANTRIIGCYFGGKGDGTGGNTNGIFGAGAPGASMGYNCIIDACVFEGNTSSAIANLAPTSVVSGCWFEKTTDVISGELFNVCVMNNFTANPLFAAFGNTLLPSNRNILLNNGIDQANPPYGNLYENILNRIQTNYIRATNNVFCGVGTAGIVTPVAGQGHFESVNPQLYLRNANSVAGKRWQIGPDAAGNTFTLYNQNNTGVYLPDGQTAWVANSDERLKEIVEPITDAVQKLTSLRTVIGRYKNDDEITRRPFLIAQDVQAVFPEAVVVNDDEQKTLGLSYSEMVPLIISAINELTVRVSELKLRIG